VGFDGWGCGAGLRVDIILSTIPKNCRDVA